MSFDLVAIAPQEGSRPGFSSSAWSWRPISHLVGLVAPDIYSSSWMFNDFTEVEAVKAEKLSFILDALVHNGSLDAFRTWYINMQGEVGNPANYYFFELPHVNELISFLRTCGGFRIG